VNIYIAQNRKNPQTRRCRRRCDSQVW